MDRKYVLIQQQNYKDKCSKFLGPSQCYQSVGIQPSIGDLGGVQSA